MRSVEGISAVHGGEEVNLSSSGQPPRRASMTPTARNGWLYPAGRIPQGEI
jgi:hypothetical protein